MSRRHRQGERLTMRPAKITADVLRRKGACLDQVAIFAAEWPEGIDVTVANMERAVALKLDMSWFGKLLDKSRRTAYKTACEQHWAACLAACKSHWDAQEVACEPHWAAYVAACEPHRVAYVAACEPDRAAYVAACKPHWVAYVAACKPHWAAFEAACEPHRAAYEAARAKEFIVCWNKMQKG